jgi:hypothetical protein
MKILSDAQNLLLWRIYVTDHKTYLTPRYFYPILTKSEVSLQIFIKVPNIKFHGNPSGGSSADPWGPTYMTKLTGDVRDLCERGQTMIHELVTLE